MTTSVELANYHPHYIRNADYERVFRKKLRDPYLTKYERRDYEKLLKNEIKNRKVQNEQEE